MERKHTDQYIRRRPVLRPVVFANCVSHPVHLGGPAFPECLIKFLFKLFECLFFTLSQGKRVLKMKEKNVWLHPPLIETCQHHNLQEAGVVGQGFMVFWSDDWGSINTASQRQTSGRQSVRQLLIQSVGNKPQPSALLCMPLLLWRSHLS